MKKKIHIILFAAALTAVLALPAGAEDSAAAQSGQALVAPEGLAPSAPVAAPAPTRPRSRNTPVA